MNWKTFCEGRRFGSTKAQAPKDRGCQCAKYLVAAAKFFDNQGNEIEILPVVSGVKSPTKWTAFRVVERRADTRQAVGTHTIGNRTYEYVEGFPQLDGFCDALRELIEFQKKG